MRRRLGTASITLLCGTGLAFTAVAVAQLVHHDVLARAQASRLARVDRQAAEGSRRTLPAVSSASPPVVVSTVVGSGATLVIPALGVRAPIVDTDAVAGSMVVPTDIHDVGWYDGTDAATASNLIAAARTAHTAPFPGEPGVAVLAGHVDWAGEGPGVLYYLEQLRPGDPVTVVGSNGETTHWSVSRAPLTVSKSALPAGLFRNVGAPRLALVTCGGPFDSSTGHYLDNVIVWASPLD